MNENQPKQSIVRYILIGLSVVLVFVGMAYIAYRFSTRGTTTVQTSPSPTPTSTLGSSTLPSQVVVPPPVTNPIDLNRPLTSRPLTSGPMTYYGPYVPFVVQNDPLTHEERFTLTREEIQGKNQLELAREQTRQIIERQKLANASTLEGQRLSFATTSAQQQAQLELERIKGNNQLALAKIQAETRAKEVEAQRVVSESTAKTQASVEDQFKLFALQQKARLATNQQQYDYQLANNNNQAKNQALLNTVQTDNQIRTAQNQARLQANQSFTQGLIQYGLAQQQANNQLRFSHAQNTNQLQLLDRQTISQIRTADAQTENQLTLNKQQNEHDLARLSLVEKQRLAARAMEMAEASKNREFSLVATRLNANLAMAAQAQQYQQSRNMTLLNARINEDMIRTQFYMQQYANMYSPYGNYGYGGYGGCGYGCF